MPDEFQESDYEDSSPFQNGDESDPTQEQPSAEDDGAENGETSVEEELRRPDERAQSPQAPVQAVQQPAAQPAAKVVPLSSQSPFATGVMTPEERAQAEELFLPEQVAFLERLNRSVAERTVQAYEQQQDHAIALGVPAQYMADVKAFSAQVPEHMRGTPEGAQAAVLLAMHERAAKGGDLVSEMEAFVKAARPPAPAPAPAEKPVVKQRQVQPVHPTAQPTKSSISSSAVTQAQRNGSRVSTLERHFAFAKED